jgi:hypothetical protein
MRRKNVLKNPQKLLAGREKAYHRNMRPRFERSVKRPAVYACRSRASVVTRSHERGFWGARASSESHPMDAYPMRLDLNLNLHLDLPLDLNAAPSASSRVRYEMRHETRGYTRERVRSARGV